MCKKQTSVSHSSTEAEIISLDAGLRMDGIPALNHMDGLPAVDLGDLVKEVFRSSPNQIYKSKDQESQGNLSRNDTLHMKNPNSTKHADLDLSNVDHVSSNVRPSRFGATLYVFEDNEAVIKMNTQKRIEDPPVIAGRGTSLLPSLLAPTPARHASPSGRARPTGPHVTPGPPDTQTRENTNDKREHQESHGRTTRKPK